MSEQAADRAAAVGNLRPDTFLQHWRDIREAKNDQADTGMALARAKKAAKRDGIDLDVFAALEKLSSMDPDDRDRHLRLLQTYSTWLDLPLAAFAEGVEVPEPRASSQKEFQNWQAGQAGLMAGKSGTEREANPAHPGTADHVAWDKGWARGFRNSNKKIAAEMVDAAKLREATQKGRNKGNGGAQAGDAATAH